MAQWGQGDPRWLVEERPDGRNINSWHWEEKSILSQVKARLGELFSNVPVQLPTGHQLTLRSCKEVTGDASLNTRKGNKRLVVYDLKVTVEWEVAPQEESGKKVSGTMRVDEYGSASEEEDYIIEVNTVASGKEEDAAKRLFEAHGKPEVLRRLLDLARELHELPNTGTATPENRDSPAPQA